MRMLFFILSFSLINSLSAKMLKNVSIIDIKFVKDQLEVKLMTEENVKEKNELYFYIYLNKAEPKFNEKLSHLLKKLHNSKYSLDLEIHSFSEKPAGSMYFDESVIMPMIKTDSSLL